MAIRTAVIGAGAMGTGHLKSLGQVPEVEIVALVDPHQPALQAAVAEYGIPAAHTDIESMLETQRPDYVVVASPVKFHAEQTIAAFEAGAHVLCEKPLCASMVEAEAIAETAKRTGRLFTMGFQQRQNRAYRALKDFIASGKLGQVYHTRVWAGHAMRYPWGHFHHRKDYSFGGVMAATVVHILDAAMWVLGAPEPVTVTASTFRRLDKMPNPPIHFEGEVSDVTVEDFGHAHVRFADGSSMSIEGNWLMHPRSATSGFEINGVLGVARDAPGLIIELEDHDKIVQVELEAGPEPQNRTVAEHEEFVAAIQGRGEPIVSIREALIVQRILVSIYNSAQKGCEI